MQAPRNILVMCRSNVDRSPFFGAVLTAMLEVHGINVISRGTATPRGDVYKATGEASIPTRQMVAQMAKSEGYGNLSPAQLSRVHEILSNHRSTVVSEADVKKADIIFTVDPKLNEQMIKLFPNHSELKTKLFGAPDFYTKNILGFSRGSTKGSTIRDPVYFDKLGKIHEVPVNRTRMRVQLQQIRLATEIANYFTGKSQSYAVRKQAQKKLVEIKKQKQLQREKAQKEFILKKRRVKV